MRLHRPMQWFCKLFFLVALLSAASPAQAEHSEVEQITNSTAYTLQDGEWNVGLWKLEYGLLDRVDIGTYTFPWLFKAQSVFAKYEWYRDKNWSVANRIVFVRLDLADLGGDSSDTNAIFTVVPLETAVSYRFNKDFTLSAEGIFTTNSVEGNYNEDDFEGAVAVTNLQWTSTLEYRWTNVTALYVHVRSLAFQDTSGGTKITTMTDPYTTVEFVATGETDALDVKGASSLVMGFHWAWDTFNMRMGGGYGNWNVPVVNFVIPAKTPIVEFDAFWRW